MPEWNEYERYLTETLVRIERENHERDAKFTALNDEVIVLRTKSALMAIIWGAVVAAIVTGVIGVWFQPLRDKAVPVPAPVAGRP